MFTKSGKSLTLKGVKPICPFIQDFKNSYIFGAFSPINGDHLLLDMPDCDTDCFEIFLAELAKKKPKEYKILFLDNGAFHKAKRLKIPQNIALLFLPPYSPELNPAEKVWALLKSKIVNKAFENMKLLQDFLDQIIKKEINVDSIKSITKTATYGDVLSRIFNW